MSARDDTPLVSVVVPVLNGEATVGDCLTSLTRMDFPPKEREIVVVFQPSTDRTLEIVRHHPVRIVVEERRGVSYARNKGIEESCGKFIAFLDADCSASVGWLRELVKGLEEGSAAAGEAVSFPPRTPVERYVAARKPLWRESTRHGRAHPWFLLGTAALRREVFDRVGLFDTTFPPGAEDIDFCWRFFDAGLQVVDCPKAIAFHRHRVTRHALWRQHVGYARGQAALSRKYPRRAAWNWRREICAWLDLLVSAGKVAGGWVRRFGTGDEMTFYYPYYDFVRRLAQRTGFVRETWLKRGTRAGG
jgi:GT2 family glycosyltransferase